MRPGREARREATGARRGGLTLAAGAIAATILGRAVTSAAQPLRLRADALAAVESPVGLLSLEAESELSPWLRAEAVVWMGESSSGGSDGDALVIAVEARRPDGRAAAKLGRILASVGALRPLHLDGAWGSAALPWRLSAEAFGGVPVAAGAEGRGFDWLVGGRLGHRLGDYGSAGVAYLQQRDRGARAYEELAFDAGAALGRHADAGAKLTLDLVRWGPAEVQLVAGWRRGRWRTEAFFTERRPSHLVPATSLFSVLGDVPARKAGARASVTAAPRLELSGEAALRVLAALDDEPGALAFDGVLRAQLWLGDRRRGRVTGQEIGLITLELRRGAGDGGAADQGWLGARLAARLPLRGALGAATELELVRPDDDRRGALWPWALASLRWQRGAWESAIAVEASASPSQRARLDALARLTRRWELR